MLGSYRGRLIRPILAEIGRLDTAATADAGAYDPDFRSVRTTHVGPDRAGGRREMPPIRVRCQLEPTKESEQRQSPAGNLPFTWVTVVMLHTDLERAELVDANGHPRIRVNDRLIALYTVRGALIQRMTPPVFAVSVQAAGFGLGANRNLWSVNFASRAQGVP